MARCLGVILILALLLCGCAQGSNEPTAPTENGTQTNPVPGLYVPDSAVEQATDGAVRGFRLPGNRYYGCVAGNNEVLLMCDGDGGGTLSIYRGETLAEVKTVDLGQNVIPEPQEIQISTPGIGYFDKEDLAVVFLSKDLVETGRMRLPENITGGIWLSPDWQTVYYCTSQGIHAMNLQTGISRLLLEQTAHYQTITGGFGEKYLRYTVEITEGQRRTVLIDAASGLEVRSGEYLNALITSGEQYFLPQMIGEVRHIGYGNGQEHQVLWPTEKNAEPTMLFGNNAVAMVETQDTESNIACYDLTSGKRMAAISLGGIGQIRALAGDGAHGLWILLQDESTAEWLYHWDYTKNPTGDEKDYTAPLYTPENPDETALKNMEKQADALGDKYGVDILIWKDAAETVPANQVFTEEYRVQLYEHYLPKIEKVLSTFPKDFFGKTSGGKLKIALVQSITGNPEKGTLAQTDCIQFRKNNLPVVALTFSEDFEANLYHGIYLYMETRLLSKSSALYEWYRQNPVDFSYDNSYITNMDRTDTTYLEGRNPAFIDLFSMSYAREDRATIFEYACMAGNEEYFESSVLQEKLRRICKGIREAYGLKKVTTEFLWEQYLK